MLRSQCQKLVSSQRCSLPNCNNRGRRQLYHLYQASVQVQNLIECKRLSSSSSTKNSNYVHPYALLNQNNNNHKKNKDKSNNVHPYKRIIEERGRHKNTNANANANTSTSKSSSLPLSRALEPYKRLNQTNQTSKNNDINSASSSFNIATADSAHNNEISINRNNDHQEQYHHQNLQPSIKTDTKSIESYVNLLSKCTFISDKLIHKQSLLSPPSLTWMQPYHNNNHAYYDYNDDTEYIERMNQYKDFHKLLNIILQPSFMKQMNILIDSPSHHVQTLQLLNSLFTNCLIVCSKSLPPKYWDDMTWNSSDGEIFYNNNNNNNGQQYDDVRNRNIRTPIQYSIEIYHLLQKINLDIQPIHYDCIIKTANFDYDNKNVDDNVDNTSTSNCTRNDDEGHNYYEFASNLFKKQINIDESGYVPIDSTLGWDKSVEMGLFSIAMNVLHKARTTSTRNVDNDSEDDVAIAMSVAKEVMDAVEEMCMVSPTDQERCKLKRGTINFFCLYYLDYAFFLTFISFTLFF